MRGTIGNFMIEIIGAFVVWMFKGFKGTISDEMSGPPATARFFIAWFLNQSKQTKIRSFQKEMESYFFSHLCLRLINPHTPESRADKNTCCWHNPFCRQSAADRWRQLYRPLSAPYCNAPPGRKLPG